jgi:predicted alpha/beta-hydrolase family hydrolase
VKTECERLRFAVKRKIIFFILFAVFSVAPACEAASKIGIVLMHGKNGIPTAPNISRLAGRLTFEGFIVVTPDMPYSKFRQYDMSYEDTVAEIDEAVAGLKKQGASRIFIAGHSLGANVALYYATIRTVDGMLAIAPGHVPDNPQFQAALKGSVEQAKMLLKEGKAEERVRFPDTNQGITSRIMVTPRIYLSWFDPEGHAIMPKNAAILKPGTALLWVIGTRDPLYKRGTAYVFDMAPANMNNKYLVVNSDHADTPKDAAGEIVNWLKRFE